MGRFARFGVVLAGAMALLLDSISAIAVERDTLAATIDARAPGTSKYQYRFNSVAVTGGGFITGFIAHPTTPDVYYVRTDIGSSYRWDSVQDQWIPLTDFISAADVNHFGTESFAIDPTDDQKLYLAQGQYTTSNNSAFYVSNDRGNTFNVYPAPFRMGSNEIGRNNGERLAVNPFKPNELYFGTRHDGLWKSTNGAKTWTNVSVPSTAVLPQYFGNNVGIVFVIFDPNNKGTIYYGAFEPGGLYVSKDSGASWNQIPGQPLTWDGVPLNSSHPPSTPGPAPMRAVLSSTGVLYVTYADFPGPYAVSYGSVWKVDTKTYTWTDITPGRASPTFPPPYANQQYPAGGYCGISIAPSDPNTLLVVSLDRDPGPALDSMYFSRDGGATYKDVSQLSTQSGAVAASGLWAHPMQEAKLRNGTQVPWLNFDNAPRSGGFGAPHPFPGQAKFGWWMAATLINPTNPSQIMYGTGTTIWATDNITFVDQNWAPKWYVKAQGIEETANLAMISPTKGATLISGFGDCGGFVHDSLWEPQPMFAQPVMSNVDTLDYAGSNPNVVVRVGPNGVTYYDGCGNGAYATDGGYAWNKFPACAPGTGISSNLGGFIAVDASGKNIVWTTANGSAGVLTGPYFSADYGNTWTISAGVPPVQSLASDKVAANTFYGYYNGTFLVSGDAGQSFTAYPSSKTGLPANNTAMPKIVVSPYAAGEIWLPLGTDGLWHSTDFGMSFSQIGHPYTAPLHFSVGAAAPGRGNPALYLWGTVTKSSPEGLYRSDDAGVSWVRVNDNAHQYGGPGLSGIQADARTYGRVYMGVFGRGIVFADIVGNGTGVLPGTYGI